MSPFKTYLNVDDVHANDEFRTGSSSGNRYRRRHMIVNFFFFLRGTSTTDEFFRREPDEILSLNGGWIVGYIRNAVLRDANMCTGRRRTMGGMGWRADGDEVAAVRRANGRL